jgi:DNA-binding transcriptional LysR family regulator
MDGNGQMRVGNDRVSGLRRRLSAARSITDSLAYEVIEATCPRYPNARMLSAYNQLRRLIGVGAWLDVAVLLIDLRIPGWQVRHIYYEDGRWVCVMSPRWAPATGLGKFCAAGHHLIELAVMAAFIDAIERAPAIERSLANVVPLRSPKRPAITRSIKLPPC